jgi:putative flippase GtrA
MRSISHARKRLLIYVAVGAMCFAVQFALLSIMVHAGVNRPVANAVAFAISAQLNFLLSSRLTWGDRPTASLRGTGGRWLAYNATALASLGCNTGVFVATYHAIGTLPAAAAGVLTGTCLVYLICNLLVFRRATAPGRRTAPGRETAPEAAR